MSQLADMYAYAKFYYITLNNTKAVINNYILYYYVNQTTLRTRIFDLQTTFYALYL